MENNLKQKRAELIEMCEHYWDGLEGKFEPCPQDKYLALIQSFPKSEQEVIAAIGPNPIDAISFMDKVFRKLGWVGSELITPDTDAFPDCIFYFSEEYDVVYLEIIETFQEKDIPCKRVINNNGVLALEILWE